MSNAVASLPSPDDPAPELPHNLSAEAAVIGSILYDNNAFQRVSDILRPIDFYAPAHQEIFEACMMLIQNGRVADGVTLREQFDKDERLTQIGGAQYLAALLDSAAFGPEVQDYARSIRDLAMRRELINIGAGVQSRAQHHDRDVDAETKRLCETISALSIPVIVVSNEVGLGLVPETPLGRAFRDAQGRLNQDIAKVCERVEFIAAGLPMLLKG